MRAFHLVGSLSFFIVGLLLFENPSAYALPAFAMRERMSCTMCHANGSAPHLTQLGFMYRRAGFRFPGNIGNRDKDDAKMKLTYHMAAGVNVDYEASTNAPAGTTHQQLTQNAFNVREAEIWPVVGAFLGNFAAWSELDMTPGVVSDRYATPTPSGKNGITTPSQVDVSLAMADLRYVRGDQNFFFSMRGGYLAPEGYGASDQWIDDGMIPLMDTTPAQFNENTLTNPLGAMNSPQMGVEFGFNWPKTYVTLGIYNGFDGTNGYINQIQSTVTPAMMNPEGVGLKDFKVQVDKFISDRYAITAVAYDGNVSLLDPGNTMVWLDNYQLGRLYGTYSIMPGKVDLLAGYGYGRNQFVDTGSAHPAGTFDNHGEFVGFNYYVMPHLTVSSHYDYFEYWSPSPGTPKSRELAVMASLPFDNNIFVFHYARNDDDLNGVTHDFRAEWRFLF